MKFAFFDVDETLIYSKSMFSFMLFWYQHHDRMDRYADEMQRLRLEMIAGQDRSQINMTYYRQFAGVALTDLFAAGRIWFQQQLTRGALFKAEIVSWLRRLDAAGVDPVLVSGSMRPLLEPMAKFLGVRHLLCAELACADSGLLTGELTSMAIGFHKRDRLLHFLQEQGSSDQRHYAFGDHISDVPMLQAVSHPHAVDPCEKLRHIALQNGWPILDSQCV